MGYPGAGPGWVRRAWPELEEWVGKCYLILMKASEEAMAGAPVGNSVGLLASPTCSLMGS